MLAKTSIPTADDPRDAFFDPSDEEVLAAPDQDSDVEDKTDEELQDGTVKQGRILDEQAGSDDELGRSQDNEEDFDAQGWGSSKQDYYNADVIETEADALEEEQEAIRLQKKQLQGMTEADFGFDEAEWLDSGKGHDDHGEKDVISEVLPQLEISESMGVDERMKILRTRYPEFEPLAREFLTLQPTVEQLRLDSIAAQTLHTHQRNHGQAASLDLPIATLKWTALSSYLGALSMYFALFTSVSSSSGGQSQAISPEKLRAHPIMDTLMRCKSVWGKLKDVQLPAPGNIRQESPVENTKSIEPVANGEVHDHETKDSDDKRFKSKRKSKSQKAAEKALAEEEARRAERMRKTEEDLFRLSALAPKSVAPRAASVSKSRAIHEDDSDFGEETASTLHEAERMGKRKKNLQFYTSQIAQKANKRSSAGRDAGGDVDIPYRERFRDRQARLNAEAETRGSKKHGQRGAPLGCESDEEDDTMANEIRAGGDDEEYYDLVSARNQKKKMDKDAMAAIRREAAAQGGSVREIEEIGPDGKRAITYAIEKNKGLTPKRKKEVRNPRVKKRKKFDEKKKKLGSVRQVYRGGEGRGYGGELTGIKTNLVRSVKL